MPNKTRLFITRFLTVLAALMLIGLTLGRPNAALAAVDELDQQQLATDDWNQDNIAPCCAWAQTFTPGRSGALTRIALWLDPTTDPTNITMKLMQGTPDSGNPVLATKTQSVSANGSWVDFVFDAPVSVQGGQTYAFILTIPTGATSVWAGLRITSPPSGVYPGGDQYGNNGTTWIKYSDSDMAFQTYLALNQAPTLAANTGLSLNEGAAATLTATHLNTTDPDGDVVTYTITSAPGHGTLRKNGTQTTTFTQADINSGLVTYLHDGTETTADQFTFTASDGKGGDISATGFTISITPVNDPPTFTLGGNVTVLEDSGAYSAAAFMSAPNPVESGQSILSRAVSNNNNGLFAAQPAIDGTGKLTFTPAANANGTATVTVQVQDDGGTANGGADTTTKTFGITVTAVNDPPSFTAGPNQTVAEDAGGQVVSNWATSISAGPVDEAGQTLSFIVTNDKNALFSVQPAVDATGTLTFTTAPDKAGTATVTVLLKDSGGGTDTSSAQTFTITVVEVNDAPTLPGFPAAFSVDEDTAQALAGIAMTDVDLVPGTASATLQVGHGTLTVTPSGATVTGNGTGTVTLSGSQIQINSALASLVYSPAADFQGSDALNVTVSDNGNTGTGGAKTATGTAAITVNAVNDPPSFTKGADQTVAEDAGAQTVSNWAASISAGPADESGQALTFLVSADIPGLFAAGPAIAADGTLTYTPAPDANGTAVVTVRLKDNGGGTDTSAAQTFAITITPTNDPPTFTKGADVTVLEDAGAQALANWATAISAGAANESAQTLTFNVTANSNPGLFAAGPAVAANGTLTFTPAADASGTATIKLTLSDDGGGADTSVEQSFLITVTARNDAPTFTVRAADTVLEDSGARAADGWVSNISPGPADEAGQVITMTVTNNNPGLFAVQPSVDAAGRLTYTPAADAYGSATVTVTLKDDGGTDFSGSDTAAKTFTITVTPVNDAPSFSAGGDQTVREDAALTKFSGWATAISAGANESSQSLTFQVTTNNDGLFETLPAIAPNGDLSFKPAANAYGSAMVTVILKDSGGTDFGGADATAAQSFTITVTPVNDVPSFTKGANQAILEDAGLQSVANWATAISAGLGDESAQTLTFLVTTNNDGIFATLPAIAANGTLTYAAKADVSGSAIVTVVLKDDGGTAYGGADTAAAQTFTITVAAVNDRPSFTKGADQTVLEDAGPQAVAGWATSISAGPPDEGGQVLSFSVSTNNNGLFAALPAIDGTGKLTYTPAPNANGSATVTVTLKDDGGTVGGGVDASLAQTFAIDVVAVNDRPSFSKGADQTVQEDAGPQTVAGWATSVNPGPANEAGQVLTFTVTTDNAALFAAAPAVAADGTLTYTPADNANGSATVTVTLKDDGGTANGGEDTAAAQSFTITVTAVDDEPKFTAATTNTAQTIREGEGLTALAATDVEGSALVFSLAGGALPSGISLKSDGTFAGTAAYDAVGAYTVTISVSDGALSTATVLKIAVTEGDTTPTLAPLTNQSYSEGQQVSITPVGADVDGDPLFYSATGLPGGLAIDHTTGAITGVLSFSTAGVHTVTVTVTDSTPTPGNAAADRASRTFTITVANVNQAPGFAGPAVIQAAEGESLPGLRGADPDGDTISFSTASALPESIRLNSDGSFSGKAGYKSAGTYSVSVRVQDSEGATGDGTVVITISNADTPPALAPVGDRSGTTGNDANLALAGSDEDGDTLTYTASGLPDGLTLDTHTGVISGTLGPKSAGVYQVTVSVADNTPGGPQGDSATRSFTWTVSARKGPQVVRGQVLDSLTGAPVPGAEVVLAGMGEVRVAGGVTGPDGRFTTEETMPGTYSVTVTARGYLAYAGSVVIPETEAGELNVRLQPARVTVSGTVTIREAGAGAPLPGVRLRLMMGGLEVGAAQWTGEDGRFTWTVPGDSDYYLLAEKEGYLLFNSRQDRRTTVAGAGEESYIELGVIHARRTDLTYDVGLLATSGQHRKYIGGYPDGTFRPDQPLTRAEAAVVIARLYGVPGPQAGPAFTDVAGHWAEGAIAQVVALGLMQGDGGGTFRPDDSLTRAEIAAVIGRLVKLQPLPGAAFADTEGHWAEALAHAAQVAGLMQGMPDGTFRPDQPVTRAEFVTVVNRALGRQPAVLASQTFPDVSASHWAHSQVEEAASDHAYMLQPDGTELHL